MLAIACHDLAALLHKNYDGGFHKGAALVLLFDNASL